MEKREIHKKVFEIVAKQAGVELSKITLEKKLVEDLNFDSLDGVETVMELEDAFNVKISDDEAKRLLTVQQIVDYVHDHQKSAE